MDLCDFSVLMCSPLFSPDYNDIHDVDSYRAKWAIMLVPRLYVYFILRIRMSFYIVNLSVLSARVARLTSSYISVCSSSTAYSGMSFGRSSNKTGPSIEPCGTPFVSRRLLIELSTCVILSVVYFHNFFPTIEVAPNQSSL